MDALTGESWLVCDGQSFKSMAQAGLYLLEKNQQIVNALNVFPVPDGDTGTNMLLTMKSAWRAVQNSESAHVGEIAKAFSRGALMGARGNSGVILSQIWRGIGKVLADKEAFNANDLAEALQAAVDTAYSGVMKPVEGTILTVIREGAEEAADAAQKSDDVRFVLRRTLTRCHQSLERTPDLLPILKQAGVVDSGGQGLVYILEGMYRYSIGDMAEMDEADLDFDAAVAAFDAPAQAHAAPEGGVLENHYDVQFILIGEGMDVLKVRNDIDAMGDSTVVVGDDTTIKVHVHVDNPGDPISYAIQLGEITDVVVENMQMQMDDIIATGQVHADASAAPIGISAQERAQQVVLEPGQIAVVAVAPGDGFSKILTDMGASAIVEGGQTNNPSTEEIFEAIKPLNTNKIILLPNNKNIFMACETVKDLATEHEIAVVGTRTVPQGIAAMLALDVSGELEKVAANMQSNASEITTVQVTQATRTVELNGVAVEEGNFIGIVDGDLVAANTVLEEAVKAVLAEVEDIDDLEILSLYYGDEITQETAAGMAETIEEIYPELEVEIQAGGQAHYHYIMGIE